MNDNPAPPTLRAEIHAAVDAAIESLAALTGIDPDAPKPEPHSIDETPRKQRTTGGRWYVWYRKTGTQKWRHTKFQSYAGAYGFAENLRRRGHEVKICPTTNSSAY